MGQPNLVPLPAAFLSLAERARETLQNDVERWTQFCAWPESRKEAFSRVMACSEFALDFLKRDPDAVLALAATGALERTLLHHELRDQLRQCLSACDDEAALARSLRQFRNLHQLRIIWRDITRQADLDETCTDLTDLADACIDLTYQWLYERLTQQWGVPMGSRSLRPQSMVILGMGKLGANELNLSSDIDLIFAFPESGETDHPKRPLDNQEFFIRLGQRLIKALDSITVDGFVFRVDMRLRPYGSSGALVQSFSAMEQYYQSQGRDWERYAMIKARVVGGEARAGRALLELLRPFVYRRYLDFTAIDSLRSMKLLIQQEVRRRGMSNNIKLGSGGIREVEFIAQAFQLIHGGRDLRLQQRSLLSVLSVLEEQGYMPGWAISEMREGYEFLRYTEHALQAIHDRQTQTLPDTALDCERLTCMMGFNHWDEFMDRLQYWRGRIEWHFSQVIADPDEVDNEEGETCDYSEWLPLWEETWDAEFAASQLQEAGFNDGAAAYQNLLNLRESSQVRGMQRISRDRMDEFIPRLMAQTVEQENPDLVLERVLPLVEAVARRSVYLVLLTEKPETLTRLLNLCAASPWIAEQIARYPALLDELLSEARLFRLPQARELAQELRERLSRIPEEDLEQQMEALRHFKLAHRLRVAASEITGSLPLMKVSDYLTWLAEAILEQVLAIVWRHMVARHGMPRDKNGELCDPSFVIVGYGKVGGIELGHASDLDLVFIHDGDPNAETDGLKPIDGEQFFTRLGQRIIHVLTTHTTSGQLYEVDMRLRPSGDAGLLVSSLEAFERYQAQEAWTWEHQALLRARVLAGSRRLGELFEGVRLTVLERPEDVPKLSRRVSEMRAKMRDSHGTKQTQGGLSENAWADEASFHLKHDAGGIVDIEFMVQYAALAWAHEYPELLRYTDNIRILDGLGQAGLLPAGDVHVLQEAYKAYRVAAHRLALQKLPEVVSGALFHTERRAVMALWQRMGLELNSEPA